MTESMSESMSEQHDVGLLDTSVVIDLEVIPAHLLPVRSAVTAVTLAELGAGPHTTRDRIEQARRMARLQIAEASYDPLPFDAAAARSYAYLVGLVGLVVAAGQSPRPRRIDLMIAATAQSNQLPLFTRNPKDFSAVRDEVETIAV